MNWAQRTAFSPFTAVVAVVAVVVLSCTPPQLTSDLGTFSQQRTSLHREPREKNKHQNRRGGSMESAGRRQEVSEDQSVQGAGPPPGSHDGTTGDGVYFLDGGREKPTNLILPPSPGRKAKERRRGKKGKKRVPLAKYKINPK